MKSQQLSLFRQRYLLSVVSLLPLLIGMRIPATSAHGPTSTAAVSSNILRISGSEPATIDPATASFSSEIRIARQIWEGLVRLDERLIPQPALAQSWSYSPDAKSYTFTLREASFSNGRRVVANDVLQSFKRVLSPTSVSNYATMLFDIQGAEAYMQGDTNVALGIQVLDPAHVRFDLVHTVPPAVFLKKLSLWVASIFPIEEVNAGGELWWRDPAHSIGSGPFKLGEWVAGDHITLVANPQHHAGRPPLDGINMRFIDVTNVELEAYQANELDILETFYLDAPMIKSDPVLVKEWRTSPGICTFFASMDTKFSPFSGSSGLRLRQAFNHAVDKQAVLAVTSPDNGVVAKGIISPASYGYNPGLQGLDFDAALARQRLTESNYSGTPQVVFYARSGSSSDEAQNIRGQLATNMGVNIALTTTNTAPYQMRSSGWCPDYPDPENYLPVLLRSDAGLNFSHYANPQVDALLDQAASTIDEAARLSLYHQAEQLAVAEAAVLPLRHDLFTYLKKPGIAGPITQAFQWHQPFDRIFFTTSRIYLPLTVQHSP